MQNYAPGSAIKIAFDLRNEAGDLLIPTAQRWRVLDEADAVLQDWAAVPTQAQADKTLLIIPSLLNALTTPATRGIRTVELEVTTADGTVILSKSAMLQTLSQLVQGVNTFMTYAQALMGAQDMTTSALSGWERSTSREDRERAMVEAHAAMLRMPIVAPTSTGWLSDATPEELATLLTARQLAAIKKAQLLEASAIMDANPVLMARRDGLMSMTVGESSQFFRTGKPLEQAMISSQAIEQLKPYLRYVTKIGRA